MYSEYMVTGMLAVFALGVIHEIPKYLIKHIWSQVNGILRRNKIVFTPNMQGDNS